MAVVQHQVLLPATVIHIEQAQELAQEQALVVVQVLLPE